jgi:hypothetical protein
MDFRGPDIGDFVYHCHILGHEDNGMMAIIRVNPPATSTKPAGAPKAVAENQHVHRNPAGASSNSATWEDAAAISEPARPVAYTNFEDSEEFGKDMTPVEVIYQK